MLIKRAQVLLLEGVFLAGDLKIESGKIVCISSEILPQDKIVDAKGLFLLPGVMYSQFHFRESDLENKGNLFIASLACAKEE